MSSDEIRKKFIEFFRERGHAIVKSSSLIPDDPSVLLTTAGMQQFKKYFTGELDAKKDFGSLNTASVQKCFRTSDIDEVGDESHLTFFEMLGNFSFGGYFKEKAIEYGFEFITKEMKLDIDYVTVFDSAKVPTGDWRKGVPFDEESYKIWQKFVPKEKIRREGIDNFWGPTGTEGPCGPTTEIYIRGVEVWNIVFNQFYRGGSNKLTPLKIQGVDTGMGLERLAMVSQNVPTIFETDLFSPIIDLFARSIPGEWARRIIADHARGITFLIADGIRPSNKEQGYILRRLIRRIIPHLREHQLLVEANLGQSVYIVKSLKDIVMAVIDQYSKIIQYNYLANKREEILSVVKEENERFERVYESGKKMLERLIATVQNNDSEKIDGKEIFDLVSTFGFSIEWIKDIAKIENINLDLAGFEIAFKKHQEISRAGKEAKFGGHGLYLKTGEVTVKDESELEKVTRLHTATHLLHAGLRAVLGPEVKQNGSDITVERTRFDFSFSRKVAPEELKKVEAWVNEAIGKDLKVEWKEMTYEEAVEDGALGFFKQKYPPRVKVYTVSDPKTGEVYSKELCGGPHIGNTLKIGSFKIIKEEAVGAGVRRIRGTIIP